MDKESEVKVGRVTVKVDSKVPIPVAIYFQHHQICSCNVEILEDLQQAIEKTLKIIKT